MGTINYGTSKYITLGINTNTCTLEIDEEFDETESEIILEDYYRYLEQIISQYNFNLFEVNLKNGYYEGLYLEIDDNDYLYFNDTKEKNEMLKEATKIKRLLIELTENGFVACFPGWCTSYLNTDETFKEIQKAIKQMKQDIKKIPTYRVFKRNGGKLI